MASTSLKPIDLTLEPELHPLYPNPNQIEPLLSANSGLSPAQKAELVSHCLARACLFGDLSVLSYLLSDPQAQIYVDLSIQDEDGLGLVSLTIYGFGAESERDVEREECVRLLIAQGADVNAADKAGWTALHHAALLSPPTLVSHLMTHGCSLFTVTHRRLTALDIVTAHSTVPGREDVALLLEEAMRGEGWTGGRMETQRRLLDERSKKRTTERLLRDDIGKALGVNPRWWNGADSDASTDSESEEEDESYERVYTPPADYSSMLVFAPPSLPQIFESLITNFQPSLRNAQPANTLYMLARFACLTCDDSWLEDLIIGATDAIEETFFNRSEDVTCLVFWLYNTTLWLHLMECDKSINEACEMLGSFELIEEVINSVYVFIIRFAERKIDQLLDAALLDHSSASSDIESVQFESDWSFLRPFSSKKKQANANPASAPPSSPLRNGNPPRASSPPRAPSPSFQQASLSSSTSRGFSSLKQTFTRARSSPSVTPLHSLFPDSPPPISPADVTSFLTALHTLLTVSEVNPSITTQLWSQVMYWTSCEIFNRILTRKKYLCRSRAVQISLNVCALEEWIGQVGLPRGVGSHFTPVRSLLHWLQGLSSITEFSTLVATIQTMRSINPLQMRRAVRDYKYEVNEGRMTEECIQYLTQLQKDWERHRVKLGVEALRKEIDERERDREESVSSSVMDGPSALTPSISTVSLSSSDTSAAQQGIDMLFERTQDASSWEPARPPQVLGELLDSRYMLPLLLPSDPRMLSALPGKLSAVQGEKRGSMQINPSTRSTSRASVKRSGIMAWRSRDRKLRQVEADTLQWVDGVRSASRWVRPVQVEEDDDEEPQSHSSDDPIGNSTSSPDPGTHITPLTRKPSARSRGRPSYGSGHNET